MACRVSKSLGVVVIGCWLITAGAGCHRHAKHGFVLHGDWTLECSRAPCPSDGCEVPDRASETVVEIEKGPIARHPCGKRSPGRWRFPLRSLFGRSPKVLIEVGDPPHSRFHPVPVRPVFSKRTDLPGPAPVGPVISEHVPSEASPSESKAPMPEEVGLPQPQPPVEPDARTPANPTTAVPRQLDGESPTPSWIFRPPPLPNPPAPNATAKAKSEVRWIRR